MDNKYLEMFSTLEKQIENLAFAVHKGFEGMDERFARMDDRFDAMDRRFDAMDDRFDRLEFMVKGHDNRIERLEDKSRIFSTKLGL